MGRPRTKVDVRCVSIYLPTKLKRAVVSAAKRTGQTPRARGMTPFIRDAIQYALESEEGRVVAERAAIPTSLELPVWLLKRIEARIAATGDSMSNYIVRSCERYLLVPAAA